jgi:hypothetical protein
VADLPPPNCPYCGSRSGCYTIQRRKVTRLYDWDGSSQDADDTEVVSETRKRCLDCDRLVRDEEGPPPCAR